MNPIILLPITMLAVIGLVASYGVRNRDPINVDFLKKKEGREAVTIRAQSLVQQGANRDEVRLALAKQFYPKNNWPPHRMDNPTIVEAWEIFGEIASEVAPS